MSRWLAVPLLLALAPVSAHAATVLAGPFYRAENGHSYYLLTRDSWTNSQAFARTLGGHLVTIDDAAENAWVYNQFSNYGGTARSLWIGLNDLGHNNTFTWISGAPVTYTAWTSGQPNDYGGTESYAHFWAPGFAGQPAAQWNDYVDGTLVDGVSPLHGVVEVVDADADGIPDETDQFPCAATMAARAFAPAETTHGALLFEDQWPLRGDLDFNDAAVTYNYAFGLDGAGRVSRIHATFNALAVGGILHNGLALHLPVARGSVASITRRVGNGAAATLSPSMSDAELTVVVSSDLRELFAGETRQINSTADFPRRTASPVVVDIVFTTPVTLAASGAPYDLFIFRSDTPSHEIHRPEFAGTSLMNAALFGTGNDGSTAARRFVDTDGLPFALVFPLPVAYPGEGRPITELYPRIVPFAASGGTTNLDFYVTPIVAAAAYRDSAGLAAPTPAFGPDGAGLAADLSCVLGQVASAAASSCRALHADRPAAPTGSYWISATGAAADARLLWCDMTTDGGGWTLISKFTGSPATGSFAGAPGFDEASLSSVATTINAKLEDRLIYALVGGRTDATFRAISNLADTVIQRTDGANPFDLVPVGASFRCKQTTASSWVSYSTIVGCESWSTPYFRVGTWRQGCDYVGRGVTPQPCGDGTLFSTAYSSDHARRQWIDGGYTAAATRAGVWYVR